MLSIILVGVSSCSEVADTDNGAAANNNNVASVDGEQQGNAAVAAENGPSSEVAAEPDRGPLLSWDKQRFLIIAEEELISRCMTEQGFDYQVIVPPQSLPEDGGSTAYRIRDEADLREVGYGFGTSGLNEDEGGANPNDPNAAYVQGLSAQQQEQYSAALLGTEDAQQTIEVDGMAFSTNTNGCAAEAANDLFGDQLEHGRLFFLVENYKTEVGDRISQAPEFVAGVGVWAECMADRSYNVSTLDDGARLAGQGYESMGDSEALAAELQIAGADADCLAASDLRSIVQQLEEQHLTSVLGERSGEILAYREMQDAAIERAKGIVSEQ